MDLVHLDPYHFFNKTIVPENPVVVKIGIVGFEDIATLRRLYPAATVIGYEADEKNFKDAEEDGKAFGVKMYRNALSDNNKMVTIHRYTNSVSNSTFPRHEYDKNCVLVKKDQVRGITLKTILSRYPTQKIDLLILNCEGAELTVVDTLATVDTVAQVCLSFHSPRIYPDEKRREAVDKLSPLYHVVEDPEPVSGGISDVLFIRKR